MNIPAMGHGIFYEFGIFKQSIANGWQVEHPDKWLSRGTPWDLVRPEWAVEVGFEGHTDWYTDKNGRMRVIWYPSRSVLGTPHDLLVPGFGTDLVNTLRLWSAGTNDDFDFQVFNAGDYTRAVAEKTISENISKVLYPNDNTPQGRELRLRQQYFFVSCALKDAIRFHLSRFKNLNNLHEKAAIQLNDTHPSIAVAELMRLLIDEHLYEWEEAWQITTKTLSYTNHTLMSEALERWPVDLFAYLLPRHLEIIFEINQRFLGEVRKAFPGDEQRLSRMSIIEEGQIKKVRMAHLATVGGHAVNGVAALHSDLVKKELLRDFSELWPEKFHNVTNGVTPRRWMLLANPTLTHLISEKLGRKWLTKLEDLKGLEKFASDPGFQEVWRIFKHRNKQRLADKVLSLTGVQIDPESLFDVQVKRLHEYKRQLLNVLHIVHLYLRIKANPAVDIVPRTFIFAAKAAPGYLQAKLIIKLIGSLGDLINSDPDVRGRIKVVFVPNFCVSLGELIYPAADLSEQISLAGTEASGTGNMKFSLNGALTIGTLDGANIEIRDAVGAENFFLFGLTVPEVKELKGSGYSPFYYYQNNLQLREVIDSIARGMFSDGDPRTFEAIVSSLLYRDEYCHFADFTSYVEAQEQVDKAYRDEENWTRMAILNVARCGHFSSDRSIADYCKNIWKAKAVHVELAEEESDSVARAAPSYCQP